MREAGTDQFVQTAEADSDQAWRTLGREEESREAGTLWS